MLVNASYQNEIEVACSFGVAAKMGWVGKGILLPDDFLECYFYKLLENCI